jgi:hypothetical protein
LCLFGRTQITETNEPQVRESEKKKKNHKERVIVCANAMTHPMRMMIEFTDTHITLTTMSTTKWLSQLTNTQTHKHKHRQLSTVSNH